MAASEPSAILDTSPLPVMSLERRAWNYHEDDGEDIGDYGDELPSQLRSREVTRRALVKVCKRWYDLAIGILYECVFLRTLSAYQLFARTLDHGAGASRIQTGSSSIEPRPVVVGNFVKRLHVTIKDRDWTWLTKTEAYALALSFQRVPNINALFTSTFDDVCGMPIARQLNSSIVVNGRLLRFLKQTSQDNLNLDTIRRFEMIQVLTITIPYPAASPFECFSPNLHTLQLLPGLYPDVVRFIDMQWITQWRAPALQRVYIPLFTPVDLTMPLFRAFGHSLVAVSFNKAWTSGISPILPHLPALQEITLHHQALNLLAPMFPQLIGINLQLDAMRGRWSLPSVNMSELVCGMNTLLDQHGSRFRFLRILRSSLRNLGSSGKVLGKSHWEDWITKWKDRGVRFEFETGELVELPVEETDEDPPDD
jgi:hypothetical protein